MRRAKLLGNRQSGKADGSCELDGFSRVLRDWGWQVSADVVDVPHAAWHARRAADQGYDVIIVAGGDGTVREAATGLVGSDVPMLVLPCGTGNDLARSLGMPLDPVATLDLVRSGTVQTIDLGEVNGRRFVNVVSLGISAKVSREVAPEAKQRWGTVAYLAKAAESLWHPAPLPLRLTVDGTTRELTAYQVSVANGVSFGGGWRVSDQASLQDQLLDIVVIGPEPLGRRIGKLLSPGGGMAGNLATYAFRSPTCRLELGRRVPVNIDGDPFTLESPLEFRVHQRALHVITPPHYPNALTA